MEMAVYFILCKEWEFDGKKGITVKCFDPKSNKIIKVKSAKPLYYGFGDEVMVKAVPDGDYVSYEIAE